MKKHVIPDAYQVVCGFLPQDEAPLRLGSCAELVGVPLADAPNELLRLVDPDELADTEVEPKLPLEDETDD